MQLCARPILDPEATDVKNSCSLLPSWKRRQRLNTGSEVRVLLGCSGALRREQPAFCAVGRRGGSQRSPPHAMKDE
jgi:hypothetical protein